MIELATAGIPENEKPAVFFSYNQIWEPTCNKLLKKIGSNILIRSTFEQMKEIGIARIAVNENSVPYNVYEYKRLSGINNKNWKHFIKLAKELHSNIDDYRVSFEPIHKNNWLKIETFNKTTNIWETIIDFTHLPGITAK